jgi:glutathione peroxidase
MGYRVSMKYAVFCLMASLMGYLGAEPVRAAGLLDIPLKDIDGKPTSLKAYEGKVLLVVNVASKCGYTRQYTPLEAVYQKYKDRGLVICGVPSNDFGGQEPGTNYEIKEFCSSRFKVTFPLFDKVKVKSGEGQHPLYAALTGPTSPFPGDVRWNFGKFLIGRDGKILARFESKDEPDSEKVTQAIESALATK